MEKKVLYTVELEGNDSALAEMAKLRKENADLKRENQDYNKSLREGKTISDDMAKTFERNTAQIKANNKQLNQLTKEVQNNGKVTVGTRKELTELRREMQELADAGEYGSEQFVTLRDRASELQDSIDRVSREIKIFADDAIVINTVTDAARGLASGFQLVQSAQALMGVENEKLMEMLVRLQAIQGVVNGLQGVSNMLQKESRIVILSKVAAQKVATAAQWAWNAAMTANPIGLIVAGVAALIAGIVALVRNIDWVIEKFQQLGRWFRRIGESLGIVKPQMDELAEATDNVTQSVERLEAANNRLERSFDRKSKKIEYEIRMLKALGAEQDVIIAKERSLLQLELDKLIAKEQNMIARQHFGREYVDVVNAIFEAEKELAIFDANQERIRRENYEREMERVERIREQTRIRVEDYKDAEVELEEIQIEIDDRERERRNRLREEYRTFLEQRRQEELTDFELREEQYNRWLEVGAISAWEHRDLLTRLNEDIAESERELARLRAQASLDATLALIRNMNELAQGSGRMAKFAQSLAIAHTGWNIAEGVSQTAKVGFPQNIPLIIGFLAQTAGLIGQIRRLSPPSEPKFEHGGIIGGKPHSQGGTKFVGSDGSRFEAEKDEYLAIINKRDSARAAMLDSVNRRHGKKLFSFSTGLFARGGVHLPQPRQDFERMNMDDVVREVVESIEHIPVIVSERDISDTMERVRKVKVAGNL